MARLWSSGFELNSASDNVEWTAIAGLGIAVQTSVVRSGTYALGMTGLTGTIRSGFAYRFVGTTGAGPYFVRTYVRFATFPSAENRFLFLSNTPAVTGTPLVYMTVDSGGVLRLYDEDGQIAGTATLSTGTWYNLEIKVSNVAAAGSHVVEARVDGAAAFASSSSRNLSANYSSLVVGGNLNAENQTTGAWYFDDVAVNDDTGASQNAYPGSGKIIHLRPDSAGDAAAWTRAGTDTGANWSQVSEVTPNSTSYNQSTTLDQEDFFNAGASGLSASDTVNVVAVGWRVAASTTVAIPSAKPQIKKASGGTVVQGTAVTPTSTTAITNATAVPRNPPITLYADPDGSAWTNSTLDSMQLGYKVTTDNTNFFRAHTIWALVDYTPAAAATVTETDSGLTTGGVALSDGAFSF